MSVPSLRPAYKRVLLKISGESFCREGESGISMAELSSVAEQIRDVVKSGVQLAIVCGGGNILRGKQFADISEQIVPSTAHYMGMLATVINGLALQDALESAGVATRLQSAIRMEGVAEPFIRRRCIRHLEKGRVVILAAGTGSPFVTTDTAAVKNPQFCATCPRIYFTFFFRGHNNFFVDEKSLCGVFEKIFYNSIFE